MLGGIVARRPFGLFNSQIAVWFLRPIQSNNKYPGKHDYRFRGFACIVGGTHWDDSTNEHDTQDVVPL